MNTNIQGDFRICIRVPLKVLKSKKKKLALTSFYCVSREIWLGKSKKLICLGQSSFYIFSHPRELSYMLFLFVLQFHILSEYILSCNRSCDNVSKLVLLLFSLLFLLKLFCFIFSKNLSGISTQYLQENHIWEILSETSVYVGSSVHS